MVVLTLAAVNLHCRLGPLLCILYRDEHDTIELHMSPIFLVLHTPVLRRILFVLLLDGSGRARALPLEPHHLRLAPEKTILGAQLLCLHLKHRVVPGNDTTCP
jgi:hypothetical protein